MSGSSEANPLDGIRDVFEAYKLLIPTALDSKPDLDFVVEHLSTVFDDETPTSWMMSRDSEALGKIRDVYKAYKKLSKWNLEKASKILVERVEQVLKLANMPTIQQRPAGENIVADDDIEILFIKVEAPTLRTDQEPIPCSSSSISMNSFNTSATQNQAKLTSNKEMDQELTITASVGKVAYGTPKQNQVVLTSDVEADAAGHVTRNHVSPLTPAPAHSLNATAACSHDLENRTDAAASTNETPVCNTSSNTPEEMILLARDMVRGVVRDTLQKSGSPCSLNSRGKNFVCHVCQKKHNRYQSLASHIWRHHLEERPVFKCPYLTCNRTYTNNSGFLSHVKMGHRDNADESEPLPSTSGRGKPGSRKSERQRVTLETRKFQKEVLEKESLQGSTATIAGTSIDTSTNYCTETGLARKKNPIRKTPCETLLDKSNGKLKKRKATKIRHQKKKPQVEVYNCSHCDKIFSSKAALKKHIARYRAPKLFVCKYCKKSYRCNSALVVHERVHTGEKPYKCTFCEYRCSVLGSLRPHEMRHRGEKPYKCSYCKQRFINRTLKRVHEIRHTG